MFNKEICVGNMASVLREWKQTSFTTQGLEGAYDFWEEHKASLRNQLRQHPKWNEDAQAIITTVEKTRDCNRDRFFDLILGFDVDSSVYAHMSDFFDSCFLNELITMIADNFGYSSIINDSLRDYTIEYLARDSRRNPSHARVNEQLMDFCAVGMKQARFLNKFFTLYGINEAAGTYTNSQGRRASWYDRWFAKLADSVSPSTQQFMTVLSVHPCDYMNMSKGTGWKSCHNMKDGGWKAGCLSYMNDNVSMVLYTVIPDSGVDVDFSLLHAMPKVNRQMFMWNGSALLSSRLYPNNSDDETKDKFKTAVKNILRDISGEDVPNWTEYELGDSIYDRVVTSGNGYKNYPDYIYSQYHTKVAVRDREAEKLIIGGRPVSLKAGIEMFDQSSSDIYGNFVICADCGRVLDVHDPHVIHDGHGNYYCDDCRFVCDICGEVHRVSDRAPADEVNGKNVCNACYEEHTKPCKFCGALGYDENMIRERNRSGKFTGKYAHRDCVAGTHAVCKCKSFQKIDYMAIFNVPGRDTQHLCSACSTVITDWLDNAF